ncbi:hypothetical protein ACTA71_010950 [Dictyostelium dimigraforme]
MNQVQSPTINKKYYSNKNKYYQIFNCSKISDGNNNNLKLETTIPTPSGKRKRNPINDNYYINNINLISTTRKSRLESYEKIKKLDIQELNSDESSDEDYKEEGEEEEEEQ